MPVEASARPWRLGGWFIRMGGNSGVSGLHYFDVVPFLWRKGRECRPCQRFLVSFGNFAVIYFFIRGVRLLDALRFACNGGGLGIAGSESFAFRPFINFWELPPRWSLLGR